MPLSNTTPGVRACAMSSNLRSRVFGQGSYFGNTSKGLFFKKFHKLGDFCPSGVIRSATCSPMMVASVGMRGMSMHACPLSIERKVTTGETVSFVSGVMLKCQRGGFDLSFSVLGCVGPRLGHCLCQLRKCSGR